MAVGVWKGVYPQVFDPSTPSMRKGRDGEKKMEKTEKYQPSGEGGTRSLPATLHRLQNPIQ